MTSDFKKDFVTATKSIDDLKREEYVVGKECGEGEYKTTKLFWNPNRFRSFLLTPKVRGNVIRNADVDDPIKKAEIEDAYLKKELNAAPRRKGVVRK